MLEAKTNQKKRARRRLVGAITLALLVVVFVPMFLDNEPKPLSEDIEIVIPPLPGDDYLEITIEDLQKQEKLATRKSKSPSARKTNKSQEKFSNSSQSGVDEVGSKRIEIGQYAVQIGAFAKFSRAQKLAKEVRKNNFNVYLLNIN